MAKKAESVSYFTIRNEILARKFKCIYWLQGEEPYFIDQLSDLIVNTALTDDEKDFNLSVYYGNEANVRDVISTCKQYPAFAEHRVVVLREAQNVAKQPGHSNDLELFSLYAEKPSPTTILVVCHKGGSVKARSITNAVKENGTVLTTAKVNERDLKSLTVNYASSLGCTIDEKSTAMLADFIGNDLARLFSEIDKLKMLVGQDKRITPELIERNIGISKDYNNFELEDALSNRNAAKAYRIIDYFEKNPKNNPVVVIVSALFSFFSSLLLIQTCKDRSEEALLAAAGTKSPFRLRKLREATRNYNATACTHVIHFLRETDTMSKGIESRQDEYDLLKELIYKILHA
ncbi:MAG: DNA polymerase III subunit delta [Muribaculaceae bacterium]|nr:DNA polymerase III subunit delta [Muribaculaceae bacterium]